MLSIQKCGGESFWLSSLSSDIRTTFDTLAVDSDCRAIVLAGAGKLFCSGIDVTSFGKMLAFDGDTARKAFQLKKIILDLQVRAHYGPDRRIV